jgi:hypothetical protein
MRIPTPSRAFNTRRSYLGIGALIVCLIGIAAITWHADDDALVGEGLLMQQASGLLAPEAEPAPQADRTAELVRAFRDRQVAWQATRSF